MIIKEKAYAKINLSLNVNNTMVNGYHSINTIMTPIDLYDEIYVSKIASGIELIDDTDIPKEVNFIYKTAKFFLESYSIKSGVRIELVKRIPIQAGLAGGSSDASATLRALNKLFSVNASKEELAKLSEQLGSDMPYCIYQEISLCSGRGEIVKPYSIDFTEVPITLVKPNYGLSTKEVYQNARNNLYNSKLDEEIIDSLVKGNKECLEASIYNDLLLPALEINSNFKQFYSKMNEISKFYMSGSGPTLFTLGHIDIEVENAFVLKTYIISRVK